jgi:hypothetical protein
MMIQGLLGGVCTGRIVEKGGLVETAPWTDDDKERGKEARTCGGAMALLSETRLGYWQPPLPLGWVTLPLVRENRR